MHSAIRCPIALLLLVGLTAFHGLSHANPQAEEGLEVYYSFDTDEAADESGNARDGSVEGNLELIDGAVGKAWQFDGTTVVNLDFPIMTQADPELSIRCFIKPEELIGQQIIYDEGGAWTGFCVRIMDEELQFATVCCGETHPPAVIISARLQDTDDWIEIAAVFGKGNMLLYIDGEKVGEEATDWQELGAHGQDGGIGQMSPGDTAFGGGGAFFVGGIDEFRIYSRMLQPDELSTAVSHQAKLAVTWGTLKSSH